MGETIARALDAKQKVLKYLGGDNKDELTKIIETHLKNDSFKENSLNMFRRSIVYQDKNTQESFSNTYNRFAKDKINENYRTRALKSLAAAPLYGVGTALALTGVGIPAAVGIGITANLILGVAEAREKRNIAAIGHGQEHMVEAQVKSVKEIYAEYTEYLNDDTRKKINNFLEIKDLSDVGSKFARYSSYISGPFISIAKNLYSGLRGLSQTATFNVVVGIAAPIMPLVNTGISYIAASLRQKSTRKESEKFDKVVEELFNPGSYKDSVAIDFDNLREKFKAKINKPHCGPEQESTDNSKSKKIKETFLQGDKKTNIKKLISLPNWVGNKIRQWIPAYKIFRTDDLTTPPEGLDNSNVSTEDPAITINPLFEEQTSRGAYLKSPAKSPASASSQPLTQVNSFFKGDNGPSALEKAPNYAAELNTIDPSKEEEFFRPKAYSGIGAKVNYVEEKDGVRQYFELVEEPITGGFADNNSFEKGTKIYFEGDMKEAVNNIRNLNFKGMEAISIKNIVISLPNADNLKSNPDFYIKNDNKEEYRRYKFQKEDEIGGIKEEFEEEKNREARGGRE